MTIFTVSYTNHWTLDSVGCGTEEINVVAVQIRSIHSGPKILSSLSSRTASDSPVACAVHLTVSVVCSTGVVALGDRIVLLVAVSGLDLESGCVALSGENCSFGVRFPLNMLCSHCKFVRSNLFALCHHSPCKSFHLLDRRTLCLRDDLVAEWNNDLLIDALSEVLLDPVIEILHLLDEFCFVDVARHVQRTVNETISYEVGVEPTVT